MNKTELIQAMSEKSGLTKKDTQRALDAFLEVTTHALKKEQRLSLPGFATFKVVDRPARVARNVATGGTVNVPAKKVVKFKVGATLAEAVK